MAKALILAAGKGTRMKSELPKVLHKVAGIPMIEHVIKATQNAGVEKPVAIVGHQGEVVKEVLGNKVDIAYQHEQLGTGHAVMQGEELMHDFSGALLVLCGDTPLIRGETLNKLVAIHENGGAAVTVLTAIMDDPSGYGRIIRNDEGKIVKIVEQKDATEEQLAIKEINTGAYCFESKGLFQALKEISPANTQGEYLLTDVLAVFVKKGLLVQGEIIDDSQEMMGINNRLQLAQAEKDMRSRKSKELMLSGVTIIDPDSVFIDSEVEVGEDSVIYPYTVIEGKSRIGENCIIGPSTRLSGVRLGNQVTVENSVMLDSMAEDNVTIGPFAYIRPETHLGQDVKVGDFVEIKKSQIGKGSKIPHLSYVGDSIVGQKVNIGAGTITCNYDGEQKSVTKIEDEAFIGSNANLVAPVEIGEKAVIAAGSTITKNVPDRALGLARNKQVNISNWYKRKGNSKK